MRKNNENKYKNSKFFVKKQEFLGIAIFDKILHFSRKESLKTWKPSKKFKISFSTCPPGLHHHFLNRARFRVLSQSNRCPSPNLVKCNDSFGFRASRGSDRTLGGVEDVLSSSFRRLIASETFLEIWEVENDWKLNKIA